MANPAKIWQLMRMRFQPPKGQGRFDPTRPLSGRALSTEERLLLENDLANTTDRYSMRGYDEVMGELDAPKATKEPGAVTGGREWHELPEERRRELMGPYPDALRGLQDDIDRELAKRRGGPTSGFASGGDRWDELSKRQQAENSLRRTRGIKGGTDRRMAEIGDQLINLEQNRAWLLPEDYAHLKKKLTEEYSVLERQRLGAKRDAMDSGHFDPDDVEGAPPTEEFTPGRADHRSKIQRELRVQLEKARMALSRGDMEAFEDIRGYAGMLEKSLENIEKLPMGAGHQSAWEVTRDVFETMTGPQFGKKGPEWARYGNKIGNFVPLGDQVEIPEEEREVPELIKQVMGIGGKVLDWWPDPINYGVKLGGEIQKLPPPQVAPEMGPQRTRRREPLSMQVPDRFGRARAALEEHRRAMNGGAMNE